MKFAFIALQLTNVVISSMLIMSGLFLFSYIRRTIHHMDKRLHSLIGLHILASALILSICEIRSLNEINVLTQFLSQLSILVLLVINSLMQAGIYHFFHTIVSRRLPVGDPSMSADIWSICMDHTVKGCKCGTRVVIFGRRSTDDVKFQ